MKLYKLNLLIMSVVMTLLAGCTTNNGDLGFLGGHWRLDQIKVDGVVDEAYTGNITWAFQNNILEMSVLFDNHDRMNYFGTWTRDGDLLTLDYTHSSDALKPGESEFGLPSALHLTAPGVFRFKIGDNPGRHMTLTLVTDEGITLIYTLSKIY